MSITKEESGTYTIQIRIWEDGTLKHKKVRGFKTRHAAKNEEARLIVLAKEAKEKHKNALPTFRIMLERYLANRDTMKYTAKRKTRLCELYFSEYLDTPVNEITKDQLIEFRKTVQAMERATSTKNILISAVRGTIRFSSEVYDIPNAASLMRSFSKTNKELNSEMQVWTVDEFNQFIDHVHGEIYKRYFIVLFWTGARRGEILGLLKQYVNKKDHSILIKHSMENIKRGMGPTKNKKERIVKLDEKTWEAIEPLIDLPGDYLFGGELPLARSTVNRRFKEAIKESKVKPIRMHDMRHSHVSILLDNGVSLIAIAKRIGDTLETVQETYAHLMPNNEEIMMNTIAAIH